jgi:pimeloyl-ACP methyl ester carboxylesterase
MDGGYRIQGIFRKQGTGKPAGMTNYKIHTPEGDLAGTLVRPFHKISRKPPVVLIIAGSGPTDRNGNSSQMGVATDCYRELADGLSMVDIASLRYDKRFVGESGGFKEPIDSLSFEDYVNDARACIRQLKADKDFSSVIVLGHSEGALIGAIAAREEKADGYISLAGAGVPAKVILLRQLERTGLDKAHAQKALDSLMDGSMRHYIASWNKYDPAREIARLQTRVEILQGLRDLQVDKEDAGKLSAAAPKAWLMYLDSMNHVLKTAPADRAGNLATYHDPAAHLYPGLVPVIESFIRAPELEANGCMYNKWLDRQKAGDEGYIKFVKAKVDSLTTILHRCSERYAFPAGYKDHAFEITVPANFSHLSWEYGDNHLGLCFNDSGYKAAIVVHYDFDGSIRAGKDKDEEGKTVCNGRDIFLFRNWDDKFAGKVYLDHHIVVAYYIPDRRSEKMMQKSITSFRFISDSPASR